MEAGADSMAVAVVAFTAAGVEDSVAQVVEDSEVLVVGGFRNGGGFRGGSAARGYGMNSRSYGGFAASRGMTGRNGGFAGNRNFGFFFFIPQSTMANGIRSVTPEVPRVSVQDVMSAASRTQASLRATPEVSIAAGTLSAGQAVPR